MRTVIVTLNDQEFEIQELRSRANAAWRKSLQEPFEELAKTLETGLDTVTVADGAGIANIIQSAAGLIIGSVDKVIELLLKYAPHLEEVAKDAYDSELMDAFVAVLGLAYPFGSLISKILATVNGQKQEQMKQS